MKPYLIFLLCIIFSKQLNAQKVFEVKFTAGVTQYRSALVLYDNGSGKMRVRFYDNGRTKMVEQTMKIENTQYGMRLTGYNPVYPGTSTRYSSYQADNFYLSTDEYGNYSLTNIDDGGVVAKAFIKEIEGDYSIKNFLSDFDWELTTSSKKKIYFKNKCSDNLKLAIRYRYNDDSWITKSWYSFDGNEGSYLSSGGINLRTNNSIVYIYAEIPNGNYTWIGDHSKSINGKYYKMREYKMTIDSDGDYYISLNCSNR